MSIINSKRQELSDFLKEIKMSETYSEKIIAAFGSENFQTWRIPL